MTQTAITEKAEELIKELQQLINAANAGKDIFHKVEYCLSIAQDISNMTGGEE